ncbi:regulatory protein RecX [Deinococcus seoulensis]|uniref:Regulatory protein RecX n=2 Tax=Deinococcus TaxID=1298 RepID=A0ABQ2RK28_9DEIO|nr:MULTISPECIES: RecX family transcriptional regulator [Deinococcus]GGR43345.1 regulatory protein RecX [Deinococcus seoulensis]GGS17746.1 regulatory protein RecX [Deinococcus knuensis]
MTGRYRPGRRAARTPGADPDATPPPARPARERTPQEQRDALIGYAFRALGQRALTEAELRAKLEKRSDDPDLIAAVLARVQELGYQDDAQVARAEGSRRGVGSLRVRQTLKRRGLTDDLIRETVEARDPEGEAQVVRELLARRWSSFARKRDPQASAFSFLARRGFTGNVIWPAIREHVASLPEGEGPGGALPDDPEGRPEDWE